MDFVTFVDGLSDEFYTGMFDVRFDRSPWIIRSRTNRKSATAHTVVMAVVGM